ncbi:hypothetical protein AGDE_14369 [Angomonas deanei]|uniref:GDP-fucose protein O-fucosyltransferase, putative n=1 Tax=Angomonas deanei TaxID=59799 RepID=A0A7G2CK94_9TRYP|nr:hypothetical protein AGDE_14369 [Angomonas deanei]CAD2219795.1 GDP-fucose protein O-fucosyltransferase, putative [Angomonas deanei]|eukprot:EPY20963.1 hypothetical protein AGDE_14369 [Angomonas deanei]
MVHEWFFSFMRTMCSVFPTVNEWLSLSDTNFFFFLPLLRRTMRVRMSGGLSRLATSVKAAGRKARFFSGTRGAKFLYKYRIKVCIALLVLVLFLVLWDVTIGLELDIARRSKGNICQLRGNSMVDVRFDSNLNAPNISIDECVATFQYIVPPDVRGKIMPLSEPTTKPIAQFHNFSENHYKVDFPVFERVTMHPANERDSASVGYNDLERCPKLFIIPLLHDYGRTHNQLQEFMSILLLSKKLDRTVVLSPIYLQREKKKQYSADGHLFLDMKELGKQFCVVSHTFFLRYLDQLGKKEVALTYYHSSREKRRDERLNSSAFLEPYLHNISSGEAAEAEMLRVNFTVQYKPVPVARRFSLRITEYLTRIPPDETIVAVQSEMAFFSRHPVEDMIRGFRHLKPSSLVATAVKEQLSTIEKPFIGLHTRHREGTCNKELTIHYRDIHTKGKSLKVSNSDSLIKQVLEECKNDLNFLLQRYNASMRMLAEDGDSGHEKGIPVYLATDGQRPVEHLRDLLLKHYPSSNVHLYKEDDTLISDAQKIVRNNSLDHFFVDQTIHLFVDYFVAAEATFFWGNTLSSFSQNVVFKRLAEGRECNGLMLGYYHYMFQV